LVSQKKEKKTSWELGVVNQEALEIMEEGRCHGHWKVETCRGLKTQGLLESWSFWSVFPGGQYAADASGPSPFSSFPWIESEVTRSKRSIEYTLALLFTASLH
jgi:hypothetical protein